MTESFPPVLFRRQSLRSGERADPHADLVAFDDMLQSISPDYPGLANLQRRREELVTAAFGGLPELDLHLEGTSVKEHATDAGYLARFLGATAAATKEVTKSVAKLKRLTSTLLVVPGTGSVRLTFSPRPPKVAPGTISAERLARVEAVGLRRLVTLMKVAETTTDPTGAAVAAALHDLSVPARVAVGKFANGALQGGYEIAGVWRDPHRGSTPVRLSHAGASRLKRAAGPGGQEVTTVTLDGAVDGWQWSSSRVRFFPKAGQPFHATVPEHLTEAVARLGAERDLPVRATFTVVTTYDAQGSELRSGKGYSLEAILRLRAKPGLWEEGEEDSL